MLSWRSSQTTERLAVARVTGAKGLRGSLRIEPLTDWPERLARGAEIFVEDEAEPRRIVEVQWGGRAPSLSIDLVTTREAAEALVGRYLEVEARELPAGSYYWHQLEGLHVTDEAGTELGTLTEVFRAGENEVYRIEGGPDGELLVPALRDVIREVNIDAGRMVVRYETEDV